MFPAAQKHHNDTENKKRNTRIKVYAFMYNYSSSPWKTQREVRKILNEEYSDGPGGLSGNDDAGQMSAWYVFASVGFYPLNPVSGEYLLCSPLFDKVNLQLPGKKV